jgi:hypothetical protein
MVTTVTTVTTAPRSVAWLGYGGLLPFVALALACVLDDAAPWRFALLSYGALILSFVGALHWGIALGASALSERQRNACFIWSTVPALLAWVTFFLAPGAASALLAAGFGAHYLQDRQLARHAGLPAWYLPLRLRLTAVASLSLLAAGSA